MITVDTEGDDLWSRPRVITTRNAEYLPRFQSLCEQTGLRPTYLVTYEMASARAFQEFAQDVVKRRAAEIGMHLHAWNSPPLRPLTADDLTFQPYLVEYPEPVMRDKISFLTDFLANTFGIKPVSHRAGRWALNETYARILVEEGYVVDCSVTPHLSWKEHGGSPGGSGGADYSRFPSEAYFANLSDIGRPGESPLLEIPMTVVRTRWPPMRWVRMTLSRHSLGRRALNRYVPPVRWLRPDRRNRDAMVRIVRAAADAGKPYVEFMVHSSELMPAGNPIFRTPEQIEALYRDLDVLFRVAGEACAGATLHEYYTEVMRRRN